MKASCFLFLVLILFFIFACALGVTLIIKIKNIQRHVDNLLVVNNNHENNCFEMRKSSKNLNSKLNNQYKEINNPKEIQKRMSQYFIDRLQQLRETQTHHKECLQEHVKELKESFKKIYKFQEEQINKLKKQNTETCDKSEADDTTIKKDELMVKPAIVKSNLHVNSLNEAKIHDRHFENDQQSEINSNEQTKNKLIVNQQPEINNLNENIQTVNSSQEQIQIYNKLAEKLMADNNYDGAIENLNMSLNIDIKNNIKALDLRNKCYDIIGDNGKLYKGIIVNEKLTNINEDEEYKAHLFQAVVIDKANKFMARHELRISHILFPKHFSVFIGILPTKENRISKMIVNKNWTTLNKALMNVQWETKYRNCSDGLFTVRSIRAALLYFKGLKAEALNCLNNPANIFETLFNEFIRYDITKKSFDPNRLNVREIVNSKNPTLLYYLAKYYYLGGNEDDYIRYLQYIDKYEFVFYELLNYYKETKQKDKFDKIAKDAIEKFGFNSFCVL